MFGVVANMVPFNQRENTHVKEFIRQKKKTSSLKFSHQSLKGAWGGTTLKEEKKK